MSQQIALRDHLASRSLSAIFSRQRHDKTSKYAIERNFAITIVEASEGLRKCPPESVGQCILDVGVLGVSLSPALKQAYLIPYKNNQTGVTSCTLSVSYMGMEQIAYRTGMVAGIQTNVVRRGDKFKVFTKDNKRQILHEESTGERGRVTHAYCIATYESGVTHVEVMDRVEIMSVRDAATKKNNGQIPFTWKGPFRYELYKKSVLRRGWKHWPKIPGKENIVSIVERTDPVEFAPARPNKEERGEASLTITEEMIGELCEIMDEAEIAPAVQDRQLLGLAKSMGYQSVNAIKAVDYEKAKATMLAGVAKLKERKAQGENNETAN